MFIAQSSAAISATSGGVYCCMSCEVHLCKHVYIIAEFFECGGNVPSPIHKGIQNVQFKMIIHFTALLKVAGVHVGPHSLLRYEHQFAKPHCICLCNCYRLTVWGENKRITGVLEQAVIITSIGFDYLEDLITAQEG